MHYFLQWPIRLKVMLAALTINGVGLIKNQVLCFRVLILLNFINVREVLWDE